MKGSLRDEVRLHPILKAITNIENFSAGKTKNDLFHDLMFRFSVERQLEIIGELANNFSLSLQQAYTDIPWSKIILDNISNK